MNVIRISLLVVLGIYFTACAKFGAGEELQKTSVSSFSSDALLVGAELGAQAPPPGKGPNKKKDDQNQDEQDKGNQGQDSDEFVCDPEQVQDLNLNATKVYFRMQDDIISTVIEELGTVSLQDLADGIEFTPSEDITTDMGVIELEIEGHSADTTEGEIEVTPLGGTNPRIKIALQSEKTFSNGQTYTLKLEIDLASDLKRTNRGCLLIPTFFEAE